jgi:hypothetical protein
MSKKNLGSSIDDFLKKENIFEEAQAQAVKEVVDFQSAHGGPAEDEPVEGGSHSRFETRYHTVESAAGGSFGGSAGGG